MPHVFWDGSASSETMGSIYQRHHMLLDRSISIDRPVNHILHTHVVCKIE
jgi:hypothetical protein